MPAQRPVARLIQRAPVPTNTNKWSDGMGAELISALCLDSLMLLCSAEHLLDHLDRR